MGLSSAQKIYGLVLVSYVYCLLMSFAGIYLHHVYHQSIDLEATDENVSNNEILLTNKSLDYYIVLDENGRKGKYKI